MINHHFGMEPLRRKYLQTAVFGLFLFVLGLVMFISIGPCWARTVSFIRIPWSVFFIVAGFVLAIVGVLLFRQTKE